MSIDNHEDLAGLREVGWIVHLALAAMRSMVGPGVSTQELAAVGGQVMRRYGAHSAPTLVYGFPGDVLISLNDEAVHGIPSAFRKIQPGDLVKLDVTFEKGGCGHNRAGRTRFGTGEAPGAVC